MKRVGFSMIELVFVIVIIGVLTAVAIPRFSIGREDACYAKLRTDLSEVETILSREYTKRFLQGVAMSNADYLNYLKTLESNSSDRCLFKVNSATQLTAHIQNKTLVLNVTNNSTTKSPTITCDLTNEMCKRLMGRQKP